MFSALYCRELRESLRERGFASVLRLLAIFTATIVALNRSEFNVPVLNLEPALDTHKPNGVQLHRCS